MIRWSQSSPPRWLSPEVLGALVQTVGQRRGGRLVHDPQDVEARDLAGLLGGLALRVVEVRRHGDDRVGDLLTEVRLGVALELHEHPRGDLLRGVLLAVDVDGPAGAHLTLDRTDGPVRVGDRLTLRDLADEHLAVAREGDDRRGGPGALRSPPSRTLTQEFVVPRSMPTARAMFASSLLADLGLSRTVVRRPRARPTS